MEVRVFLAAPLLLPATSETDFDKAEWRIPAERMKMRDPHIVPLSNKPWPFCENCKLIPAIDSLCSSISTSKPLHSENTLLYARYSMGYHSKDTGHGFRPGCFFGIYLKHASIQIALLIMNKVITLVQQQYTEWPYPDPIANIAVWRAMGLGHQLDLKKDHPLLWPERDYNPRLSILIAGCGTMEAAVEAYNYPEATILGIDLSPTSIEHTNQLKKKHNLRNLELKQMDLCDVASLGIKFDLVVSFGVLHHLPDPQQGLKALASALRKDGVIFLTLYGKYLRTGVSMLQEALRLLKVGQTRDDINFTRGVIQSLPPHHPLQTYLQTANDLDYEAGIVDTFLHPQETAFSVPDVLSLASSCNLDFQGWYDNLFYYPDGAMTHDQPLYQKILTLPVQEQWAAMELLVPPLSGHRFMLRNQNSNKNNHGVRFDDDSFKNLVPTLRHRLKVSDENEITIIEREWHKQTLTRTERGFFHSIDGQRTINDIATCNAVATTKNLETTRQFFSRMWRLGHMNFQITSHRS